MFAIGDFPVRQGYREALTIVYERQLKEKNK